MFLLEKKTVQLLSQAQHKRLLGRLRLDISSRRLPGNPLDIVDEDAACEALGERLLRTLSSVANDAVLLAQKSGWDVAGPPPPLPDANSLIRVMPSADRFESYLTPRLDQVMGLNRDSQIYSTALAHLATDLFSWVHKEKIEAEAHRLELHQEQVFVRCLAYDYRTEALGERRVLGPNPSRP